MAYKIVDADYVLDTLGQFPLLDVRPAEMYNESRIPGAVSVRLIEAKEDPGDTAEIFTERVKAAGFEPSDNFIVYCYNGQLANEACTLLESQGYSGLSCYEGSWVDWISDETRPVDNSPKSV